MFAVERAALDLQATEQRMALGHLEQTIRERYQRELTEVEMPSIETTLGGDETQLARLRERLVGHGRRQRRGSVGDRRARAAAAVSRSAA